MSITITDLIPPPTIRASKYNFVWQTMTPGQSVDLPLKQALALRAMFFKRGWKAVTSKQGTEEFPLTEGCLRLWRVADPAPVQTEFTDELLDAEVTACLEAARVDEEVA